MGSNQANAAQQITPEREDSTIDDGRPESRPPRSGEPIPAVQEVAPEREVSTIGEGRAEPRPPRLGHLIRPIDRARIRAESGVADDTVKRWPDVRDASKRRIERSAKKLKIELPKVAQ